MDQEFLANLIKDLHGDQIFLIYQSNKLIFYFKIAKIIFLTSSSNITQFSVYDSFNADIILPGYAPM